MKFIDCVTVFQQLEKESSRTEMMKLLADLLKKATAQEGQIIAYLSMGSMLPPYKQQLINIAGKGMIDVIAQLTHHSSAMVQKDVKKLGDAGLVVEQLWDGKDQGLTVVQVYNSLIEIAQISGTGSTEKKVHGLVAILKKLDGVSAKFVVRIVMQTMRLGFSDMTFLDALSWMQSGTKKLSKTFEHAYNVCADLGLVTATLIEHGIKGVEHMKIEVGVPIRPAAAERMSDPKEIVAKLGDCVAQPKLDGFRVQVHIKNSKQTSWIAFFSRNLLNMSDMFPDLARVVTLLPVQDLIFEGEAIVYDENTNTFLPFQQTVKRKRKHDIEQVSQELPLRLYVFDILYCNGESMLNHTHEQRRKKMLSLFAHIHEPSLQPIEEKKIHDAADLQDYFLHAIESGLEGLVIKRVDAIYQPGKRNFNWIKLKREAHGSLIDTIDGVILGYYVGRGKRAKFGIGAFLVGVYDAKHDTFVTVAKIGTGMSDTEWKALKHACDQHTLDHQPKNVVCAPQLAPDVWVAPKYVCTIQSDEITLSPIHTAGKTAHHSGYALRFPRFITYREDKSATDATTVEELQHLYKEQKS